MPKKGTEESIQKVPEFLGEACGVLLLNGNTSLF